MDFCRGQFQGMVASEVWGGQRGGGEGVARRQLSQELCCAGKLRNEAEGEEMVGPRNF